MSDERFYYLSPLLSGQRLLQQFLLSHLFHPNVSPILVQQLDKRRTSGLVAKKKHLERAGEQRDIPGMFLLRNTLMNLSNAPISSPDGVLWSL